MTLWDTKSYAKTEFSTVFWRPQSLTEAVVMYQSCTGSCLSLYVCQYVSVCLCVSWRWPKRSWNCCFTDITIFSLKFKRKCHSPQQR